MELIWTIAGYVGMASLAFCTAVFTLGVWSDLIAPTIGRSLARFAIHHGNQDKQDRDDDADADEFRPRRLKRSKSIRTSRVTRTREPGIDYPVSNDPEQRMGEIKLKSVWHREQQLALYVEACTILGVDPYKASERGSHAYHMVFVHDQSQKPPTEEDYERDDD